MAVYAASLVFTSVKGKVAAKISQKERKKIIPANAIRMTQYMSLIVERKNEKSKKICLLYKIYLLNIFYYLIYMKIFNFYI